MIHLTLTGYDAGRPICGINKQEAIKRGDTFIHYMYASDSLINSPEVCENCRETVNDLSDDTSAESYLFNQ